MTNNEIKDLARKYLLAVCGRVDKNWQHEFENFISWMVRDHCIVSRDKVRKHYKDYAFLARKHPKASERHLDEIIIEEIEELFGKSTFEERSEK